MNREEREKKYAAIERECSKLANEKEILLLIDDAMSIAKKNNDTDYVFFFQAEISHYEKDYQKAIGYLKNAIEINKTSPLFYRCLGVSFSRIGDEEKAIEQYDIAIKINPEDYDSYRNKGVALSKLGDHEKAIEQFDIAIKINPEDYHSYRQKGVSLSNLGDHEKAIEPFEIAIKINPEDYHSYRIKGVALSKLGDEEKAIEQYDIAIKINPEDYDSYRQKGVSLSRLGDAEKAIEQFEIAIKINPEEYLTKGWLGDTYRTLRQFKKAEPLLKESLKQNFFKDYLISSFTETLYRLGKYDKAKKALEEGLREFPDYERLKYVKELIEKDSNAIEFFDKKKKELEEEKTKQRAYREKYEQAERFSERMIHKIGNAGFFLNGVVQNIKLDGCSSFNEETLSSLEDVVQNVQSIINELNELKTPISKERKKSDFAEEVRRLTKGIEHKVKSLEIRVEEKLPPVPLHINHFRQAVGEIIENGIKCNGKKIALHIDISLSAPPLNRYSKHSDHILMKISDDGTGIPPAKKETVFEPFFSLSNGSGLGLTIVKKIVEEEHLGIITETGKDGEGAVFELYFPIQ